MIEAPHFSPAGARKGAAFPLPEAEYDGTVNRPVLHEAVRVYLANQRQGTHATKTRSHVSGGNQKPWKQKGTGRARQGSIRAPNWPGGGTVFGPLPRDYRLGIPRKVRQLARRSALNARASEGRLYVVERFEQQTPRTRELVALLEKLEVASRKVLLLAHGVSEGLYLSGRNLPRVRVRPYTDVTAYDVLWSDVVVVEEPALAGEPGPVRPLVAVARSVPEPRGARPVKAGRQEPRAEASEGEAAPSKTRKSAEKKAAKPAAKPAGKKAEKSAAPKAAKPAAKKAEKPAAPKAAKPAAKKASPRKKGEK